MMDVSLAVLAAITVISCRSKSKDFSGTSAMHSLRIEISKCTVSNQPYDVQLLEYCYGKVPTNCSQSSVLVVDPSKARNVEVLLPKCFGWLSCDETNGHVGFGTIGIS